MKTKEQSRQVGNEDGCGEAGSIETLEKKHIQQRNPLILLKRNNVSM